MISLRTIIKNLLLEKEETNNTTKYVYHGTYDGAARSIQRVGRMVIDSANNGSKYNSFTSKIQVAKNYASAKGGNGRGIILRTKLTKDFRLEDKFKKNNGFEWITTKEIPTKDLELYFNNQWIPLNKYDFIDKKQIESINNCDSDKPYGGWLDANCNFHEVNFEQHRPWARKFLKQHDVPIKSSEYPELQLYALGFVRIVITDDIVYYTYDPGIKTPTNKQLRTIKDLAIEYKCKTIHDTENGRRTNDLQEVRQRDIKSNLPPVYFGNLQSMTLGNLKALRDKAGRTWEFFRRKKEMKDFERDMFEDAQKTYLLYNNEINRRLAYINKKI